MPVEARIRELDTRHHQLDEAIDQETKRPTANSLHLTALKKEKLKLKEQIEGLRRRP